jgi:hypothetical protein
MTFGGVVSVEELYQALLSLILNNQGLKMPPAMPPKNTDRTRGIIHQKYSAQISKKYSLVISAMLSHPTVATAPNQCQLIADGEIFRI